MKNICFLIIGLFLSFQAFAQWSADPAENTSIVIASGEQAIPKISVSEDGTSYVSWFSNEGNYNVRLQKLDVSGNKLWADEGLLISDNEAMSWLTDWDLAVGPDNCAILAFQDVRNGSNNIYAYCISPDGGFIWGTDGLALSNSDAFDASPKICVTNSGNTVFAWQADDVIIFQKVSPDGTLLWGPDGITLSGGDTYSWPQLIPVGDDDVIMKYFYDSGPVWSPTRYVYAQRYDSDGSEVWAEPAIVSNAGGISAWTQVLPFINDGNDGFFIAWHDDRDMNNMSSIFVHHIGNDGLAIFLDNGVEASLNSGMNHFYAYLALPQGSDDVFVFWNEMDGNQTQKGIYGQKISSTGERLWTDNGKSIVNVSSVNLGPIAANGAEADMVVFYEEYFDAVNTSIKAMRLDSDGDFVWPGEVVTISSVQSPKIHPDVGGLYNGQWIAVWGDERGDSRDIYGQNIQMNGTLGPVDIQGELEVHPDSVICDDYGPYYVYVVNNTEEIVVVESAIFQFGYCHINFPSSPEFPYTIDAGDSLIIEIMVVPGSIAWYNYVNDFLDITTNDGDFQVVFYIDENLIAETSEEKTNIFDVTSFPNPSSGNVIFDIQSGSFENLTLDIYNPLGEKIKSITIITNSGEKQEIVWDRKNNSGIEVQPGIYTYRIGNGTGWTTGKIVIAK